MSMFWSQPRELDNKGPFPKVPMRSSHTGGRELQQEHAGRPIRVLIADDHELVRRGLRSIFATDPGAFEVCAEAASGREAIELARKLQPDVVVIDVSMPELEWARNHATDRQGGSGGRGVDPYHARVRTVDRRTSAIRSSRLRAEIRCCPRPAGGDRIALQTADVF